MIKWNKRSAEYYEGRGFSGIALTIKREDDKDADGFHWSLYAGDNTQPRTRTSGIRQAKSRAEVMFG
jgi:hypothetical protein